MVPPGLVPSEGHRRTVVGAPAGPDRRDGGGPAGRKRAKRAGRAAGRSSRTTLSTSRPAPVPVRSAPAGNVGKHKKRAVPPRMEPSEVAQCDIGLSMSRSGDRTRTMGPGRVGSVEGRASGAWGSGPGGAVRRSRPAGGRRPRDRNPGPVRTAGGRRGVGRRANRDERGGARGLRGDPRLARPRPARRRRGRLHKTAMSWALTLANPPSWDDSVGDSVWASEGLFL